MSECLLFLLENFLCVCTGIGLVCSMHSKHLFVPYKVFVSVCILHAACSLGKRFAKVKFCKTLYVLNGHCNMKWKFMHLFCLFVSFFVASDIFCKLYDFILIIVQLKICLLKSIYVDDLYETHITILNGCSKSQNVIGFLDAVEMRSSNCARG